MTERTKEAVLVVEIERSFNAPLDTVYRAFTQPDAVGKWGVGRIYENISVDIDLRVGGVIYQRVLAKDDGAIWTFFGVYTEVEEQKKLAYTFDWKTDWREDPSPNLVEIEFFDGGESTEIKISHADVPLPGVESVKTHWTEFLDLMTELLEKKEIV
jgi:uncharacterized protein YndB with AHSA1/START domain